MLKELGLTYQLHMLPFPPRALARSFLQENPLGTVPMLQYWPATPSKPTVPRR